RAAGSPYPPFVDGGLFPSGPPPLPFWQPQRPAPGGEPPGPGEGTKVHYITHSQARPGKNQPPTQDSLTACGTGCIAARWAAEPGETLAPPAPAFTPSTYLRR